MKLTLVFRDIENKHPNYDLNFKIRDTALAQHWTDLLIKNILNSNHPIEKPYSLHGWQTSWDYTGPRNLDYLCEKLNGAINFVNFAMGPLGYPHIDLTFSVDKLRSSQYQQLMNDIHHHFEILIGQSWAVSDWYKKADATTRMSIRLLNNYCHEIESVIAAIKEQQLLNFIPFVDIHPSISVNVGLNGPDANGNYFLLKQKDEITLEEYDCFSDECNWGSIFIYYAQLGKTHFDAFKDKDTHIDKNNISGWRYLTGEFVTFLPINPKSGISKKFKRWLKKHEFDINDKSLGIGYPIVADIDTADSRKEIGKQLRLRNDLYQIILTDDQGNIQSRTFDYTWQDLA